jgi:hypothetical protein
MKGFINRNQTLFQIVGGHDMGRQFVAEGVDRYS